MTPKHRRGKAMVSRPYVPDSVKPETASQHAIVRKLGPHGIWSPALHHILKAADELAAELGKPVDQLTDAEAEQAIATGKQRLEDDQQ
jgi:hypothetical protein